MSGLSCGVTQRSWVVFGVLCYFLGIERCSKRRITCNQSSEEPLSWVVIERQLVFEIERQLLFEIERELWLRWNAVLVRHRTTAQIEPDCSALLERVGFSLVLGLERPGTSRQTDGDRDKQLKRDGERA